MDVFDLIDRLETDLLKAGLDRYERKEPVDRKNRESFLKVKQETEPIFQLIHLWEETVEKEIHRLPVFPNQIKNTRDNMELLLMHSYYKDVRKKRFMELYHSIRYVFNQIQKCQLN